MNLAILAHTEGGYGWGSPFEPWEFHPALNHLPIAFLLGGVAVDLYAWWRGRPNLSSVVTGLLVAGVLTGGLAWLSGVLALFTVPAHTEEAHWLMYWHAGVQTIVLAMFAWVAWKRWRKTTSSPWALGRVLGWIGAALLLVGSGLGGYIVYHGGAGIDPQLLTPEVRQSHTHGGGNDNSHEHANTVDHDHRH
ncbi:DUF2231 domain-containing protein [Aeoliella sp.]|uniref:DUF2231 domain-containing protein n=1 Tax=Aeoliella sp. TaxID=2795800 RepID=UPI003CCBC1AB